MPKLVDPTGGVRKVVDMAPGRGVKMAFAFDTELVADDLAVRVPRGQYILVELETWARILSRAVAAHEPDEPSDIPINRQARRAAARKRPN